MRLDYVRSSRDHTTIAVSGTAENQGRFYGLFEHVVYLHVPLEVLLHRVRTRSNNPYGKTAEQQADITRYVAEVEPLIRGPQPSNSTACSRYRHWSTALSNA